MPFDLSLIAYRSPMSDQAMRAVGVLRTRGPAASNTVSAVTSTDCRMPRRSVMAGLWRALRKELDALRRGRLA